AEVLDGPEHHRLAAVGGLLGERVAQLRQPARPAADHPDPDQQDDDQDGAEQHHHPAEPAPAPSGRLRRRVRLTLRPWLTAYHEPVITHRNRRSTTDSSGIRCKSFDDRGATV